MDDNKDGMREAIVNLKKDVTDLHLRLHAVEIGGCPMGSDLQKQIITMREDIQYVSRLVMRTSAGVTVILIAAQLLIRFL